MLSLEHFSERFSFTKSKYVKIITKPAVVFPYGISPVRLLISIPYGIIPFHLVNAAMPAVRCSHNGNDPHSGISAQHIASPELSGNSL